MTIDADALSAPEAPAGAIPVTGDGAAATGAAGGLLRPLAFRDFRLVWAGQSISLLGDQFHQIALAWLILGLTGSGLALGVVLMAASIPRAILIIVGGALADRVAPRNLMLASDVARGLAVSVVAVLVLTGRAEVPHLVVMALVFGIADAFFLPAMQAIIPALVPTDRLAPANALVQGTTQLMTLLGPVAAGVLVAAVGTGPAFVVDAVSFAIAGIALALVRTGRPGATGAAPGASGPRITEDGPTDDEAGPRSGLLGEIGAGLSYTFASQSIRTLVTISAVLNFAITGAFSVGLPWLVEAHFGADATMFGLIGAGFGLGALLGAIIAGSTARPPRMGAVLLGIFAGLGVVVAAVGIAPDPWIVMGLMLPLGVGIGYSNVVSISWLGGHIAPEMRGRVMGLVMFAGAGLAPISLAVAGMAIDVIGPALFVVSGLIICATSVGAIVTGAAGAIDRDAALPAA